jgi:hypothetical protein
MRPPDRAKGSLPSTYNASVVAARATGTDKAFGFAPWALIGVFRPWKHFGGFLMHIDVSLISWTFAVFDLCFVEIQFWSVVK